MRRSILAFLGLAAALSSGAARAGVHADTLGRCATEATSAADRTALLRWMFIVAGTNPALADLTAVTPEARDRTFRAVGDLYNRVLLTACRREAVAAIRHEGIAGIQGGFEALGRLAALEMMTTPAALTAMEELSRYMDMTGMEALEREAAARPAI